MCVIVDQAVRRCPDDGHLMLPGFVIVGGWPTEEVFLCDCCGATLPRPVGD